MSSYSTHGYEEAGYPRGFNSPADFTRHFGFVRLFVPFEWRDPDPFELHGQVREYVDGLPDTASSFTKRRVIRSIDADIGSKQHRRLQKHLIALGCWECETEKVRTRWANPSYIHDETLNHVTGDADRRAHAAVAASVGFVDAKELAPAWGVESMKDAFHRLDGFTWEDARRDGAKAMFRTVKTAAAWSDRTLGELLDAVDVPRRTYYEWRERYELEEFEPPTPPSEVYGWPETG